MLENWDKNIWHDSSIEKITIEYNDIIVDLETDAGMKIIVFRNYIAIDYIGQWDENIVESIYEERDADIIKYALNKVNICNDIRHKGGGTRDINSDWKCIVIKLIDGVCIRIVCDNLFLSNKT